MMSLMATKQKNIRSGAARAKRTLQTTLRLPDSLYQKARQLVTEDKHVDSMNELIITALSAYLKALDRKTIDRAFAGMANDQEYQNEAELIAREFSESDAEATQVANRQFAGQR
jgi:hypothetical protein